jgi:hypothetical protein
MENYQKIGKLNLNKLGKYKKLLATDEVILTEERIHHIKEKHQEQYDELKEYIEWVVYDPDYILQDMQHNETIILLKEILKDEKRIKMIIRLSVNPEVKNNFSKKSRHK